MHQYNAMNCMRTLFLGLPPTIRWQGVVGALALVFFFFLINTQVFFLFILTNNKLNTSKK